MIDLLMNLFLFEKIERVFKIVFFVFIVVVNVMGNMSICLVVFKDR